MYIAEIVTTIKDSFLSIGAIKDSVLSIGAIVAMYVAVRGLKTWNRQLKGEVEYELTRRLLRCTYLLREAIKVVRNPVMFANEKPSPPDDESKSMSNTQRQYYGLSQAYQGRWNKVTAARDNLQTELLEAEVIWGKHIYEQFEPLFKLQDELFSNIHRYLMVCNPQESDVSKQAISEVSRKLRDVLYDTSSFEADPFSNDVEKAIADIETFLKPHLKK